MSETTSTTFTPNDPEYFEVYCSKHYDNHDYRIVFKNGQSVVYHDYAVMKYEWYSHRDHADHVEVVDRGGKGF